MRISPSHVTEIHLYFLSVDIVFFRLTEFLDAWKKKSKFIQYWLTRKITMTFTKSMEILQYWERHLNDIKGLEKFYKKFSAIQSMIFRKIRSAQGRPVDCKVKGLGNYRFKTGKERKDGE
ncbi:hypothetical protein EVAR_25237_1 [Eumeta japonica]|uniref:Uncharacterized protein n=1 Tax=Eumeta variegata TaxID=151549 RepID=A0A4C1WI42_EUMVA|nr:hypothetical protein EVAR_25237_1 [Eumeta japonica]